MSFQIERAREYYRRAWELLPAVDRKRQRPGLLMAAIYRATLEKSSWMAQPRC
jgi:phytoene synthase